jgi:Skp family chaperone for outer membrane proteins
MTMRRGARPAALTAAALMAALLGASSPASAAGPASGAPAPGAPAPSTPAPSTAANAAAAGAVVFGGPSVPGVCLLSQQALFSNSKVGGAAAARLQQLQQQVQSSLMASKAAIDAAGKALAAQRSTLPEIQFDQKERALNQRLQALQVTADQRNRQLDATRAMALRRIGDEARPAIVAAYQARGCGVLFDRASVVAGGLGMDITDTVVQALDAKITTLTFDLERPTAGQ